VAFSLILLRHYIGVTVIERNTLFMPFKKGHKHSPGRKPGSQNKVTKKVRETLTAALNDELENIPELLKELEPKERLDAIAKLLPYCAPKLQAQQIDIDTNPHEKKRPAWMMDEE